MDLSMDRALQQTLSFKRYSNDKVTQSIMIWPYKRLAFDIIQREANIVYNHKICQFCKERRQFR